MWGVRVCGGKSEDVCGREWYGGTIHELLISRHKWTPYQLLLSCQAAGTTCPCVAIHEPTQALVSILVFVPHAFHKKNQIWS